MRVVGNACGKKSLSHIGGFVFCTPLKFQVVSGLDPSPWTATRLGVTGLMRMSNFSFDQDLYTYSAQGEDPPSCKIRSGTVFPIRLVNHTGGTLYVFEH